MKKDDIQIKGFQGKLAFYVKIQAGEFFILFTVPCSHSGYSY